ncbi:MAG: peptidoglycan synthetase [Lentimicrobium sp.]|jgi:UDP-N-acetylmuramate: L-alanyl-gamma-D-glutamyl-meso-diaminopimelate ligase|nr:peptidoglycan synthetase [Lentimicrobium sp.]MDD2527870.1 Mur ligase family protein [Lentimicrobiaceae bacterium]MDD4596934.1 Mur ligase family protein [Lentimicrobiaceae bacterium]MDY0024384.1 Mur ligase family protein [Lentimicrobium sp.]HAH58329.1 peptidoglycan synthetase [Bacteroidales bacterium]
MKVHFIAIGGSAMHNLAIALHLKGYKVTGSDDEIFEPAHSRLKKYGLLPAAEGWDIQKIHTGLDAIILGMHARSDNPEIAAARKLNIPVYSYPEFLYEQSGHKKRVVIGGSHGKTTITAMILHVLKHHNIDADYMVGAQLEGFEVMVRVTEDAPVMIIEGDEYLTSALDRRPKFHVYQPDIGLISGIAWDHMNVFPTFENYLEQFSQFAQLLPKGGSLIYCAEDEYVVNIAAQLPEDIHKLPYTLPPYHVKEGITILHTPGGEVPLKIFGQHNLLNLEGARLICQELDIDGEAFYDAIQSFVGASKRLELVASNANTAIYKDFAHSPSKLKATIQAVKEQFPGRKLTACFELHTYSSLNKDFLSQYAHAMDDAEKSIVFYSKHALELKRLKHFDSDDVVNAFKRNDIQVYNETRELQEFLVNAGWNDHNLLLMSSGNFFGLDLDALSAHII